MRLQEALLEVKDPRRVQGMRANLLQMLSMIIISNLCGYFSGREISTFLKSHKGLFKKNLELKHGIPSHTTFSSFIRKLNTEQLKIAFHKWMLNNKGNLVEGGAVSGDGKALRSTVRDEGGKQNFDAVVSMFCQKTGLVLAVGEYKNAKKSEIEVVKLLMGELENMGLVIYLDALHTQKKL